jgi:hypothetical protein
MTLSQHSDPTAITSSLHAFAAISLAALACDKIMDRDEVRILKEQLLSRPAYAAMSEGELSEMFEGLLVDLRHCGIDAIIKVAVSLLSQHQCETALAVATQLLMCDGPLCSDEKHFLDGLSRLLGLDLQRSSVIVEVIGLLFSDI